MYRICLLLFLLVCNCWASLEEYDDEVVLEFLNRTQTLDVSPECRSSLAKVRKGEKICVKHVLSGEGSGHLANPGDPAERAKTQSGENCQNKTRGNQRILGKQLSTRSGHIRGTESLLLPIVWKRYLVFHFKKNILRTITTFLVP